MATTTTEEGTTKTNSTVEGSSSDMPSKEQHLVKETAVDESAVNNTTNDADDTTAIPNNAITTAAEDDTAAPVDVNDRQKNNDAEILPKSPPTEKLTDEKENTKEESTTTPNNKRKDTNSKETDIEEQQTSTIDVTQPVKRARTAYFIFADEKRSQIQTEKPGAPAMAKALGQLWATISDEEKLVYQQKAAAEREKVAQAVEAWKAAGGVLPDTTAANNSSTNDSLVFPINRIRKICKLDPEVRNLSKEALLLVTKAAELALQKMGKETVKTASIQNRRKLLPEDLVQVCSARDQFQFLREDIQDLHRKQQKESTAAAAKGRNTAAAASSKVAAKPLTDYFAPKK